MIPDLFDNEYVNQYSISKIPYQYTKPFILNIHYAKRMPHISHSFGLYENNNLVGIITYGNTASQALNKGIMGDKYAHLVIELNRLVLLNNKKNEASILISKSLKLLPKPLIVVSYADPTYKHLGYVYQATNFIYTGLSAKRTEWVMKNNNKHNRTVNQQYTLEQRKNDDNFELIDRPRKHRYIYFLGNKTEKKYFRRNLKYKIHDYPK